MKAGKQTVIATCPDCAEKFLMETRPKLGQNITCPNCQAHLKVISLKPLKLNWDLGNLADDAKAKKYWTEEYW